MGINIFFLFTKARGPTRRGARGICHICYMASVPLITVVLRVATVHHYNQRVLRDGDPTSSHRRRRLPPPPPPPPPPFPAPAAPTSDAAAQQPITSRRRLRLATTWLAHTCRTRSRALPCAYHSRYGDGDKTTYRGQQATTVAMRPLDATRRPRDVVKT